MESIQQVIDDVENFIHDIETKNVIVTDKADTVMAYETGKGILGRSTKKEIANLKSVLGTSIAEYKINKHFPVLRWEYARICEAYIDLARTNNVLEYPNLSAKAQKFDELEKEHEK